MLGSQKSMPLSAASQSSLTLHFRRVLLANAPTGSYCREDRCQSFFKFELIPSMRAPLEECEVAGALTAVGAAHLLIDAPAEHLSADDFILRVKAFKPDLIVLAVTFGSLEEDLGWIEKIKLAIPFVTIGIRGAPCYVWDKQLLTENLALDFCVRGDYELVFEDIAKFGIEAARGTSWRNSTGSLFQNPAPYAATLDELPLADRSQVKRELYTVRGIGRPQATIHVQRGCPFPCSYCLVHTVSGNKARHRSAQGIAKEMAALYADGVTHFYLRAETFTLNRAWAIEVSRAIAKACPQARWVTTTRVECVDRELVAEMRRAGCYGISFGIDVATEEIGRKVRKPPQLSAACEAVKLCNEFGILSLGYFMIGFIWDTPATIRETKKFIKEVAPDLLTIHFAHPYPGTEYYKELIRSDKKVVSLRAQSEPALGLQHYTPRDLERIARGMLLRHYLRPKIVWSLLRKLVTLMVHRI